ncbi:MAG: hypothetical protein J5545_07175 [Bacteroidaceae bacterium]|nr:hypothetical protein [Bacteroidaceae bacterium]
MQSLLVSIIIVACVAYTIRRLWRRLWAPPTSDPRCADCPLKETCLHSSHSSCCHDDCGAGRCDCQKVHNVDKMA